MNVDMWFIDNRWSSMIEDTMTLGAEALVWMDNLVCDITRCTICIPNI